MVSPEYRRQIDRHGNDIEALYELVGVVNNKIDDVRQELNGKIDTLTVRVERLETRFDGLETRFDGLETRFDGLEAQMNDGFAAMGAKLDAILRAQNGGPSSG